MGRLLPVFLMRAATLVVASLLLFAVFGHARAQDDNYGLKRFSGDNYDSVPSPGACPRSATAFGWLGLEPHPTSQAR
ncbi:MAG TPA: hypothetical protein VJM78_03060 [Rhizomicrobium sp.]|nr:hypothetical protein [Rhizomicrobium sp.]